MFRRLPRAIFRGGFKPNIMRWWIAGWDVVQLSKKFGLKTPLKMARGWRRNMSGKF
jgi:hypothetical protein